MCAEHGVRRALKCNVRSSARHHRTVRTLALLALIGVTPALAGCYASHRRGGDAAVPRDGDIPAPDAGAPPVATVFDAGAPPTATAPDAGAPPFATGPDAGSPPVATGPDAGPPPIPTDPPIADSDVCDAVCDAMVEAGCPVPGCVPSCEGRRERAAEIGCGDPLKDTLLCIRMEPCVEARVISCGEEHGWAECLRGD